MKWMNRTEYIKKGHTESSENRYQRTENRFQKNPKNQSDF
jgi:hypothetical protein